VRDAVVVFLLFISAHAACTRRIQYLYLYIFIMRVYTYLQYDRKTDIGETAVMATYVSESTTDGRTV